MAPGLDFILRSRNSDVVSLLLVSLSAAGFEFQVRISVVAAKALILTSC